METSRRGFLWGLAKAPLAIPALSMVKLPEAKAEPKPVRKHTTGFSAITICVSACDVPASFASETFDID